MDLELENKSKLEIVPDLDPQIYICLHAFMASDYMRPDAKKICIGYLTR